MFKGRWGLLVAVLLALPTVAASGCGSKSSGTAGSAGSGGGSGKGPDGGAAGGAGSTTGDSGQVGDVAGGGDTSDAGGGREAGETETGDAVVQDTQDGGCQPCDSGSCDPNFCNVVLLHFDGVDGGAAFTDVKGHAVTAHGSAQLTGTTAAFGGTSGYFDGTTGYLTLAASDDWNFGASDFTVELFANFKGGAAGQTPIPTFFSLWGPTCSEQGWQLNYNVNYNTVASENDLPANSLFVGFSTTGSDEVIPGVAWTPPADSWVHIAAVRHGSQ